MNNEEERKRAIVSNLLDRQAELTPADPFALMKELTQTFNKDNELQEEYTQFQDNISSKMETSLIGNLGNLGEESKREKRSISPNRLKDRRIFGNEGPSGNRGTEGIFKHRDLFNKAQDREKKTDWYTQFQESKEKFMQVGMGE